MTKKHLENMRKIKILLFTIVYVFISVYSYSQSNNDQETVNDSSYSFVKIIENPATPVKNQSRSGTCWDFAGISFLESELIRKGKGEYDLSEMYVVRQIYPLKAEKYIRYHGSSNFSMGGQAHDVTDAIKLGGIVPEEIYPGVIEGEESHNHRELDAMMKAFCNVIIKKRTGKISDVWQDACNAVLDVYLGEIPESFTFNGKEYTPVSFATELEINPDDYIELTSYSNYPYYKKVILEVPDNWTNSFYYNVPLNDLINVMNYALIHGYTFAWDGHVSGRDFSFDNGVAIIPQNEWKEKSKSEKDNTGIIPEPQKQIDQEIRQKAFDNQTVNDQHLMHVTGLYNDQNGVKYYNTKNSWGTERNDFGGYIKMSEPYMRLKTIAIMIHKDALPPELREKLGL